MFLKELRRHFIDGTRTDLSELEKQDLKLGKRGGDRIYKCLHRNVVRGQWKDHRGYPLKEKYHSKGLLVCSYSIRKIAAISTYSDRIVRECLSTMEELQHLKKDKGLVLKIIFPFIKLAWVQVKRKYWPGRRCMVMKAPELRHYLTFFGFSTILLSNFSQL